MKLKSFFKGIACSFFLSAIITNAHAQLNVVSGVTPLQLAQALVGPGAIVLNPVLTGAAPAYGTFTNGNSTNLGIDHGIILTSGTANMPTSNTSGGFTGANGLPGDALLSFAGTTYDACRFEFDVVAYDSVLTFNYVFGSDEYTEYVNAGFNDAFGFFISGPGIVGQPNIALIPGGATPVSIDNVNCASAASAYYVCNEPSGGALCSPGNCAQVTTTEYDGFTTLLTAQASVMACDTYHLVLVVADVGDGVLDSGVLIANLLAGTASVASVSAIIPGQPNNTIIEGCTTGNLKVKKITSAGPCSVADTSSGCSLDSLCYSIVISGNAIEGVDYDFLPDTICFSPGDTVVEFDITPIADGFFEPPYDTITLDLFPIIDPQDTACAGVYLPLHATFYLMDPFIQTIPDDTICASQSITLTTVSNMTTYAWTPAGTISCPTCLSPSASPTGNTTYTVTGTIGPCNVTDQVTIYISPIPIVNAGTGGSICPGENFILHASNANTYYWLPPANASLSDPNLSSPIATPSVTTTYTVQGSNNLCGNTTDTAIVTVNPLPNPNAWPDSTVCPNASVLLHATGGVSYAWTGFFLNDSTLQNPLATPTAPTVVYTVTVTNQFGCTDTAQVTLHLYDEPISDAGADVSIYLFDSTQLNANGNAGSSYSWIPPMDLSDPFSANPWASPTLTTTYYLTMISADGCVDYDTMIVTVRNEPLVKVPSAFSPNSDGHNDYLKIIRYGVFNLEAMKIYNRWGELVYESHNISDWWDGKFKGEPAEVGVYVYYLTGRDYSNNQIELQGNITLLR